jgi:hypothetical protein
MSVLTAYTIPLQLPTVRWSAQAFARKTGSPFDQADEGRKVKIIPRRQACPQVTSPLSSECPLVAQSGLRKFLTMDLRLAAGGARRRNIYIADFSTWLSHSAQRRRCNGSRERHFSRSRILSSQLNQVFLTFLAARRVSLFVGGTPGPGGQNNLTVRVGQRTAS